MKKRVEAYRIYLHPVPPFEPLRSVIRDPRMVAKAERLIFVLPSGYFPILLLFPLCQMV